MGKGEKAKMPIKSRYSNIKYSSSNKKVATISANGMITCVGKGTANITAELNGDKKVMKLTVTDAPKSIKINGKKTRTVKKGKSIKLSFKLSGGYSYRIIWSTSNSKVATVTSYGVVKGKKKGKATIKIKTYNGKTYKITVNVK